MREPRGRHHGRHRDGGRSRQGNALPGLRRPHRTDPGAVRDATRTGRERRRGRPTAAGAGHSPLQRVPALLDALLCFKLDNRHLALALEATGSDSPYQAEHYERWHSLLRSALEQIPGLTNSDFTAHALLATVRADLVEHLAGQKGVSREDMRKQLATFVAEVLGSGPDEAPR